MEGFLVEVISRAVFSYLQKQQNTDTPERFCFIHLFLSEIFALNTYRLTGHFKDLYWNTVMLCVLFCYYGNSF